MSNLTQSCLYIFIFTSTAQRAGAGLYFVVSDGVLECLLVDSLEKLPGMPGEVARRARRRCLAGPEKLPGGPREVAWRNPVAEAKTF